MRYLVTGCAGFIGSHIVERLLERGDEVVGLDNFATGHRHNIEPFDFEFIEGDIRDLETCKRACEGVDHVIHQAALGSVPRSVEDPIATHESNATGTLNMLVAARDAEAQSFVFAASSSAYGDTPKLPKVETMPKRPMSPYAVTKSTCEDYLKVFHDIYGLNTVGLRYFNIFGPRQDPNGPYAAVIPKFIQILQSGETPTIHGDGGQTRDFTYIDNAVDANLLATEHAANAEGRTMNIACGDRISINELYEMITRHLGVDRPAEHGPPRPGDVRDSLADISLARELIDYEPAIDHEEGLRRTVAWFEENR
jgi:nucleoside-diphosphate-sugar epimerase